MHRTGGLICYGDLRPEGFAAKLARGDLFVNALGTWVNESKSGEDVLLLCTQIGVKKTVLDGASLTAGLAYYHYTDIENSAEFLPVDSAANRLTKDGRYLSAFELLEGLAELSFPTAIGKTSLYTDYVKNLGANDYNTAYSVGAKLSVTNWKLIWAYQEIEADAVYAILTDSDFAGGGTDSKGHKLEASYAINSKVKFGGTLFLKATDMDFGDKEDYRRLMLDAVIKY